MEDKSTIIQVHFMNSHMSYMESVARIGAHSTVACMPFCILKNRLSVLAACLVPLVQRAHMTADSATAVYCFEASVPA